MKSPYFEDPLDIKEINFVKNILNKNNYDAIIVNYTNLCNIFELQETKNLKKFVLTNDVWHRRLELFKQQKLNYSNIQQWTYEKEQEFLNKSDVIVAIQDEESSIFKKMCPNKKIIITPISFKQVIYPEGKNCQEKFNIICVGSGSDVNKQGIEYFIDKIFPLVLKKYPDVLLNVYCDVSNLFKDQSCSNVIFHGRVNDLSIAYQCADVAIVPLLAGTGLKIKFVEALAHSTPIVATKYGIEGCLEANNYCAFRADDEIEFANRVIQLIEDYNLRKNMEINCIKYLSEHFTPKATMKSLCDMIND